jgi:hypothetical protein
VLLKESSTLLKLQGRTAVVTGANGATVAGETIVRGVENRRPRILVGADTKRAAIIERLMPVTYWNFLGRRFKK